jgi:hypothetical protein
MSSINNTKSKWVNFPEVGPMVSINDSNITFDQLWTFLFENRSIIGHLEFKQSCLLLARNLQSFLSNGKYFFHFSNFVDSSTCHFVSISMNHFHEKHCKTCDYKTLAELEENPLSNPLFRSIQQKGTAVCSSNQQNLLNQLPEVCKLLKQVGYEFEINIKAKHRNHEERCNWTPLLTEEEIEDAFRSPSLYQITMCRDHDKNIEECEECSAYIKYAEERDRKKKNQTENAENGVFVSYE